MIEVKNVTKQYGKHIAANNVSFKVNKGEILGLLGPNGAGKTTTMNIITGYLSATHGVVSVAGYDVLEEPEKVKENIGYLPESPPVYPEMTVFRYLDFACRIKKVPKEDRKENISKALDRIKITDVKNRMIGNLSRGYQQRVALAQALVANPPIIILDEPTLGLDPKQIIECRNLIKTLGKEHTVILSSHILPEVTAVCDRVVIIHRGNIVAIDTIDSLSNRLQGAFALNIRIAGSDPSSVDILKELPKVAKVEILGIREPGTLDIHVEAEGDSDIRLPVSTALCNARLPVLMMKSVDLTLEEIFIQLTTDENIERSEMS